MPAHVEVRGGSILTVDLSTDCVNLFVQFLIKIRWLLNTIVFRFVTSDKKSQLMFEYVNLLIKGNIKSHLNFCLVNLLVTENINVCRDWGIICLSSVTSLGVKHERGVFSKISTRFDN